MRQSVGHLDADVATPDDDGRFRSAPLELSFYLKRILHRVKFVYPRKSVSFKTRAKGNSAGCNHELVVCDEFSSGCPLNRDLFPPDVDMLDRATAVDIDPFKLRTVREAVPVRRFPTKKKWKAADAEVREIVREKHADLRVAIYLAGAQGGADSRVGAANDPNTHIVCDRYAWRIVSVSRS